MNEKIKRAILIVFGVLVVGVVILVIVIAINGERQITPVTAADAWESVLKHCTQNELFRPDNMVYLGPSNNTGIGTIWRRVEGGGGYELKRLPPDLPTETFSAGNWSSCSGTHPASFAIGSGADAAVISRVGSDSGALAANLKRSRTVRLNVDTWRQVELVGDAFSDWVQQLPETDPYKRSLLKQDRVVAYREIEVKGMTATFSFDESAAAELRGKFGQSGKAEAGGRLSTEFKGGNTLKITAPDAFIIEAEFATYSPSSGDFRGGFSPLKSEKDTPLTADREDL